MRYFKLFLIVIFVSILLLLFSCSLYNNDGVYYYKDLYDALSDISEGCIGRRDKSVSDDCNVALNLLGGTPTICLLNNITTDNTINLNNTNIDLNGFTLKNNKDTLITTHGICRVYNGALHSENVSSGIIVGRNSTCYIENISFKSENLGGNNIAINVYGNVYISNSEIEIYSLTSSLNTVTIAVYGNLFSNVSIEKSNIVAKSDFGRVDGVCVGDIGRITDSNIVACANYQSDENDFTSCAIGCNNLGSLQVNNCVIYGVHSGINSRGSLFVDGGVYSGYGHGGIYCAGIDKTYKIKNSTILQAEMPIGYEDMGVGCMQGGLYIGGGKNQDNINVFIDNCIIKSDKNSIVLRGTSGEKNNSLYISNTTIDVKHIRIDNDTHRIYIGAGCNFEAFDTDIPDVVVYTGDVYLKN